MAARKKGKCWAEKCEQYKPGCSLARGGGTRPQPGFWQKMKTAGNTEVLSQLWGITGEEKAGLEAALEREGGSRLRGGEVAPMPAPPDPTNL